MKKVLNASIARIVLSLLLLIILSAMVGLVIFAYSFLSKTSEEVGKMQTEAIAVDAKIQSLLASKSQLDRNSDTVKKAKNIVSESKLYQYQNQIIQDLNTYANRAGIPIKAFSFQNEPTTSAKTAKPSKRTSTNPAGVKSTFVSIQLGDHIDYTKFLHFLSLIEKNVTRMQLLGVSISRGANNHEISIQSLEVKVYTR
ncbi:MULTISPECIES: hypothetical protein [unclassified Candidatus Nanosynbacter]|jgi:hypothetical protein|uniref:hypothetical protein n=1 Tax=unclassified Candidatus Nanosynbacter TaxID=2725944 RepID=UPI001FB731A6|nr:MULTISPECIES: hypothetical protein [unclassified Candidatus Nanosynbacter]MCJ1963519.1 hypothetical protein [Candidatus Nanosynbacter sp. TM7-033]UOG68006.1 hypothetical protein LRM46_00555 [Candidatus Nanosynbacter sp. HMT-352]